MFLKKKSYIYPEPIIRQFLILRVSEIGFIILFFR